MTAFPETDAAETGYLNSTSGRVMLASLAGLGSVFSLGIVTGVTAGFIEKGAISLRAGTIGTACLVIGLALAWYALRKLRAIFAEPTGKKTRRARILVAISLVIGAVIGVLLNVGSADSGMGGPLDPTLAIGLAVVALVVIPVLTLIWWRALDEHEAGAYSDGALIALNAYLSITAAWWVLEKGGLAGPVEPMPIFMLTVFIWSVVWSWKRYF